MLALKTELASTKGEDRYQHSNTKTAIGFARLSPTR